MRITVTTRQRIEAPLRTYAEEKLQRLARHAHIEEAAMVIDHDGRRVPPAHVEVIIHMPRVRMAVKVEAESVREAIDLVVDKADRRVVRRKERINDHRPKASMAGGSSAGGADDTDDTDDTDLAPEEATGLVSRHRVDLPAFDLAAAMEESRGRDEPYFLYRPTDGGDVALLLRRHDGYQLIVGSQT